jgi:hypothetical protein
VAIPNLMLIMLFPLIFIGISAIADLAISTMRRRKTSAFPGGADRFYSAVMIAAVIRSALFSLMFLPPVWFAGVVAESFVIGRLESSVLMVLPALFGAYFATRLERFVFEALDSGLLKDRAAFLSGPRRIRSELGR